MIECRFASCSLIWESGQSLDALLENASVTISRETLLSLFPDSATSLRTRKVQEATKEDIIKILAALTKQEREAAKHKIMVLFARADLLAENMPADRLKAVTAKRTRRPHKPLSQAITWLAAISILCRAGQYARLSLADMTLSLASRLTIGQSRLRKQVERTREEITAGR